MLEIPLLDADRQALTIRLGAVDIRLTVWWQPGTAGWYFTAEVPVGTRLVSGRRITVDTPLLQSRQLDGELYCRATGAGVGDVGPIPWGRTHRLVYEP